MEEKKRIFASPQDAEAAFYEALERADLDAMMSVWAEDEDIICVHPGWPRLAGFAAVQESFRQIFGSGTRMKVTLSHQVYLQGLLMSVHNLHENIVLIGEGHTAPPVIIATNIYLRSAQGWRMLAHHASPAPAPPEPISDGPKILH